MQPPGTNIEQLGINIIFSIKNIFPFFLIAITGTTFRKRAQYMYALYMFFARKGSSQQHIPHTNRGEEQASVVLERNRLVRIISVRGRDFFSSSSIFFSLSQLLCWCSQTELREMKGRRVSRRKRRWRRRRQRARYLESESIGRTDGDCPFFSSFAGLSQSLLLHFLSPSFPPGKQCSFAVSGLLFEHVYICVYAHTYTYGDIEIYIYTINQQQRQRRK